MNNIKELKEEDLTAEQKRDLELQGFHVWYTIPRNGRGIIANIIMIDTNGIIRAMKREQEVKISITPV